MERDCGCLVWCVSRGGGLFAFLPPFPAFNCYTFPRSSWFHFLLPLFRFFVLACPRRIFWIPSGLLLALPTSPPDSSLCSWTPSPGILRRVEKCRTFFSFAQRNTMAVKFSRRALLELFCYLFTGWCLKSAVAAIAPLAWNGRGNWSDDFIKMKFAWEYNGCWKVWAHGRIT